MELHKEPQKRTSIHTCKSHPVDFGHFVSPAPAFVSLHQLKRRALPCWTAQSEKDDTSIDQKCVIFELFDTHSITFILHWPAGILILLAVDEGAWLQLAAHHRNTVTTHGCVPHHPFTFRVTVYTRDWGWQPCKQYCLLMGFFTFSTKNPNMLIHGLITPWVRSNLRKRYVRTGNTYIAWGEAVLQGDSGLAGRLWWSGCISKSRPLCTVSGGSRNTPGGPGWPYFFHRADMALSFYWIRSRTCQSLDF